MPALSAIISDLKRLRRAIPDDQLPEWPMESARARQLADILVGMPDEPGLQREQMVTQLRADMLAVHPELEGVGFERLAHALTTIPREDFLSSGSAPFAYLPTAISIGHGQTISHPQMVAAMIVAARIMATDHVLDVGTGSGYQAAVVGKLAAHVTTIELIADLAWSARRRLECLGAHNVECLMADARSDAWKGGPFDAILVAARSPDIPAALIERLKIGGRLIMPLGIDEMDVVLTLIEKGAEGELVMTRLGHADFVPLLGEATREGIEIAALVPSAFEMTLTPVCPD